MPPRTYGQAASELGISERMLRDRVNAGEWPCHRFGPQTIRFTDDDLAEIERLSASPASAVPLTVVAGSRSNRRRSAAVLRARREARRVSAGSG